MLVDPFNQALSLATPSGPTEITISELDAWVMYKVQISINYGTQIGASIVLLLALLLLTRPEKRSSALFTINVFSLVLNVIRNVLLCVYFTGPFVETYAFFAGDYSRVTRSAYAVSITASVFEVLVLACIETSLGLQMCVICITLRRIYRTAILMSSGVVGLTAVAIRFALTVENSKLIVHTEREDSIRWLGSASNITTTISICSFCAVFSTKLAFALYWRKKLGISQFGPMQVIFIMSCQTMILPVVFSTMQYFVSNPAMSSNVITSVAISLPLSSLWASASTPMQSQMMEGSRSRCDQISVAKEAGLRIEDKTRGATFSPFTMTSISPSRSIVSSPTTTLSKHSGNVQTQCS